MDYELFCKVGRKILDGDANFEMYDWVSVDSRGEIPWPFKTKEDAECGTSFCLAGHIAIESGEAKPELSQFGNWNFRLQNHDHWEDAAYEALGLEVDGEWNDEHRAVFKLFRIPTNEGAKRVLSWVCDEGLTIEAAMERWARAVEDEERTWGPSPENE